MSDLRWGCEVYKVGIYYSPQDGHVPGQIQKGKYRTIHCPRGNTERYIAPLPLVYVCIGLGMSVGYGYMFRRTNPSQIFEVKIHPKSSQFFPLISKYSFKNSIFPTTKNEETIKENQWKNQIATPKIR